MLNFIGLIKENFLKERERWFLWLPFLLACGILWYFHLANEPPRDLGLVLLSVAIFVLIKNGYASKGSVAIMSVVVVLSGFSIAQVKTMSLYKPNFITKGTYVSFSGRIGKLDIYNNKRRAVIDKLIVGDKSISNKIKITFSKKYNFEVGDYIKGKAKLSPPSLPVYPDGYDMEQNMYFNDISASGYAYKLIKDKNGIDNSSFLDVLLARVEKLRHKMSRRIVDILGADNGSIIATIIAGDKGSITYDRVRAYRNSGLAHFLSISGLHMSMVSGLVFLGIRCLLALFPCIALNYNIKKIAASMSIVMAFVYLLISGASVPTQRAFIMVAVIMLGVLLNRRALSLRTISFAAIMVMLISPFAVVGASFQMSFFAVVALISAYNSKFAQMHVVKNLSSRTYKYKAIYAYFIGVVFSDLIASLATTPFALYHFNQMAPYTLLANFMAAPFIGFIIMPFAIVSALLMPFGFDKIPLQITSIGVEKLNQITDFVSSLKGAEIITPHMPDWGIFIIAFSMLWLCLWQEKWRYFAVGGIVIGLASPWLEKKADFYISEDASTIAYKDDGIIIAGFNKNSFVQRQIFNYYGIKYNPKKLVNYNRNIIKTDVVSCDNLACLYKVKDKVISLSFSSLSLAEDCKRASVIVALYPVNSYICENAQIIDRFDLYKNGGYFIYADGSKIKIISSANLAGNRLWRR